MADIIIGNSGFKYSSSHTKSYSKRDSYQKRTCTVKYVKDDKILFTIYGGMKFTPYADKYTGSKKFLGLDNRYYYIQVTNDNVSWGQIQSSGAVLTKNRTILTQLNFYPLNVETPTIPLIETPVKKLVTPVPTVTNPPVTSKKIDKIDSYTVKKVEKINGVSWIEQIQTIINRLVDQIMKILKL